ncbi:unnamed protein product [Darwinula stevensoni]|uniref:Glutamate-gated chloride channel n=1 Tax=Darwinula stevensoni TaxID=69355 RepID=A0A7R9FPY3_9CRUS|nr:unnamed protein product [Darwinula stevensoni]CAD7250585.1 unnamed protein product [Darwinula stevensoni]CAG0898491.1 unnamed protein product [Darwinula stevensoni]CAG0898492.1 unnamed protein product [Darwinula stevensoni]
MEYSVQLTFREQWKDDRLTFNDMGGKIKYLTLTDPTKLWMPDLFFQNEKEGHLHNIILPNVFLRISPDGGVMYSIRISLTLSCPMNLKLYPLDRQTCQLRMASYGWTTEDLVFLWKDGDPVQIVKNLHLPRFTLEKFYTDYCNSKTNTGEYSCLRVDLMFKREFSYYLIQIYIPCCMLVIVSWVSFWLDQNAIPARVSLGVTTLLTMATQTSGINASLPPVSYTKAIDVWTGVCLTFVFGALLEFALVNYASRSDMHRENMKKQRRQWETEQAALEAAAMHSDHLEDGNATFNMRRHASVKFTWVEVREAIAASPGSPSSPLEANGSTSSLASPSRSSSPCLTSYIGLPISSKRNEKIKDSRLSRRFFHENFSPQENRTDRNAIGSTVGRRLNKGIPTVVFPPSRVGLSKGRACRFRSRHVAARYEFQHFSECVSTGEYSCLRVDLIFKREFSYYLIQIYIPSCMLVIVSWVSFWLDHSAVVARVSLGVTTLLTMATQTSGINASLPPVSYTKTPKRAPCLSVPPVLNRPQSSKSNFGVNSSRVGISYSRTRSFCRSKRRRSHSLFTEELEITVFVRLTGVVQNEGKKAKRQRCSFTGVIEKHHEVGSKPLLKNCLQSIVPLASIYVKLEWEPLMSVKAKRESWHESSKEVIYVYIRVIRSIGSLYPVKIKSVLFTMQAIDVWTGACLTFVFGALLEYALVNYASRSDMHRERALKEKKQREMEHTAALEAAGFAAMKPLMGGHHPHHHHHHQNEAELMALESIPFDVEYPRSGRTGILCWGNKIPSRPKRIDVISRITFPLFFALFNIGYWAHYLFHDEQL